MELASMNLQHNLNGFAKVEAFATNATLSLNRT
jgi:hypothetical protein